MAQCLYGQQAPCSDQYKGFKTNVPQRPFQMLIGTYVGGAPPEAQAFWAREIPCPIQVYEDEFCVRRYVVGEFWDPANSSAFLTFLTERGISKPQSFIFSFDFKISIGWGQWIDFGERIE
jgi:hypothetical protein